MKFEFWAVLKASSGRYPKPLAPRITVRKPTTARNEVAVKMVIEVPASLFEKPMLVMEAALPDVSSSMEAEVSVSEGTESPVITGRISKKK